MSMLGEMGASEAAALGWHTTYANSPGHAEAYSPCWCCCTACDPDFAPEGAGNPYFVEAQAAMKADRS